MEEMQKFAALSVDKLRQKKTKVVSSSEALKDVIPIDWSSEIKLGDKKVAVSLKK